MLYMLVSEIGTLILPILSLELTVVIIINVSKSQQKSWVKNCKQASTCSLGDLVYQANRTPARLSLVNLILNIRKIDLTPPFY